CALPIYGDGRSAVDGISGEVAAAGKSAKGDRAGLHREEGLLAEPDARAENGVAQAHQHGGVFDEALRPLAGVSSVLPEVSSRPVRGGNRGHLRLLLLRKPRRLRFLYLSRFRWAGAAAA